MKKTLKAEDSKLTLIIPESEKLVSDSEIVKSPITSPRVTRQTLTNLTMAEISLNILFKFVKSYDGKRETLNSFLVNCDNAYNLASEAQKPILFKFILSQLDGKAETACSIKDFTTWELLKDFLKTQFSERKHYSHLLTDLQESKQEQSENVSQYALRVETYLSQLLTEISLSTTKSKELPGRTAAMEDLALHHFLMGLHPRVSNIVRCRSPKNLNEAINLAVSEERIQQTLYKRPQPEHKTNKQTNVKPNPNTFQKPQSVPQTSSNVVCRYCKNPGHDISTCKKREFNNRKNLNPQQASTSHNANKPSAQVNLVEQPDEPVLVEDVDSNSLNE